MLNTTDATLGNAFDSHQVESLPLDQRNVPDLLSLQPGVTFLGRSDDVSGTQGMGNTGTDSRAGSVNGGRSDQSNITLDGVDVNDINNGYAFTSVLRTTQDSVAEFRVTTSNPNAEEGRSSGAQVALVTRSGSNALHGAVYEYNRSNLLEANDFFNKQQELAAGSRQSSREPGPQYLRRGRGRTCHQRPAVLFCELRGPPRLTGHQRQCRHGSHHQLPRRKSGL